MLLEQEEPPFTVVGVSMTESDLLAGSLNVDLEWTGNMVVPTSKLWTLWDTTRIFSCDLPIVEILGWCHSVVAGEKFKRRL